MYGAFLASKQLYHNNIALKIFKNTLILCVDLIFTTTIVSHESFLSLNLVVHNSVCYILTYLFVH